jgi:hypothetical protein
MTPRHGYHTGLVKLDGREVAGLPQRWQHNRLVSLHIWSARSLCSDGVVFYFHTSI